MIQTIDCKDFNGYKPCRPGWVCATCDQKKPRGTKILIINLDALGAVLMSTALLPAIKRRDPQSTIHWVTLPAAVPLLQNNPYIDRIWPYDFETVTILQTIKYDRLYSIDKAFRSDALAMLVVAKEKLGFSLDENGVISHFNPEAEYAYRLGIDDELKFRKNNLTGIQFLAQSLKLDYQGEDYVLALSPQEIDLADKFRREKGIREKDIVIGFNTGCSDLFPNKKMTIEQHLALINRIKKELPEAKIILLGGRAEGTRNREIMERAGEFVINSPTDEGIRMGMVYVNACDLIITGDTSAMHMAIALKKYVVAWFGLSCAGEIDLFGRGEKIVSDLSCSPCWKKSCDTLECIQQLDVEGIFKAGRKGYFLLREKADGQIG